MLLASSAPFAIVVSERNKEEEVGELRESKR
jgi:hypothetical protein